MSNKVKCSLCHELKPESELNGLRIVALDRGSDRQNRARCRNLAECNSTEARRILDEIAANIAGGVAHGS